MLKIVNSLEGPPSELCRAHMVEQKFGDWGPCTYGWDPLSGEVVQLGLLGLQVLPKRLLQCRTQDWNSPVSTNRGGGTHTDGRKKRREGGHKSRHIIVTHQPKGSNKGRHAVLSPVQCWPASSQRRRRGQRVRSLIPTGTHRHTTTQRKNLQKNKPDSKK